MLNALSAAIWTRLTGGTALTALLGDGTAGVFEDHAGQAAALPYVIFHEQAGNWDQTMREPGGSATRFYSGLWSVRAVSGSAYPKEAAAIDAQIDARLHDAALTVTGFGLLRVARESTLRYPETEGNQTFQHVGALYRVELYKS